MSIFKIETNVLESASTTISNIGMHISELGDMVNYYDINCEDGFDFSSVKSLIAKNIEACSIKMKNTSQILEAISQSHTKLQNELKFEKFSNSDSKTNTKKEENNKKTSKESGTSSNISVDSGNESSKKIKSSTNNNNYSYYGGQSVPTSTKTTTTITTTTTTATTTPIMEGALKTALAVGSSMGTIISKDNKKEDENKTNKVKDISNSFKEIGYQSVNDDLSEVESKIFKSKDFKYDKDGYAKIGDKYIVAVDETIAKKGDIIKFTQEDGKEIEAVVGMTKSGKDNKDKIDFFISSDDNNNEKIKNVTKNLISSNKKIETIGNMIISKSSKDNSEMIDSIMSEVDNTISNYSGLGFHDGEWCADFVSNTLNKNGYDIKWSSIAGDGPGEIFGSIRDAGGKVHLDLGSRSKGLEGSVEYDPSYVPQKGDVVLFDFQQDGINDHVGFVIQDNGDGTVKTIEGNTNGNAGGSCVGIHNRDRSTIYGYATPIKKEKEKDD